jgi:hypothetical protein
MPFSRWHKSLKPRPTHLRHNLHCLTVWIASRACHKTDVRYLRSLLRPPRPLRLRQENTGAFLAAGNAVRAATARLRFICFRCRGGYLALLVVRRLWYRTDMPSKPIFFVVKTNSNWTIQAEWPDGTVEEIKTFTRELQALDWLTWQSQTWLAWRETDFSSCS